MADAQRLAFQASQPVPIRPNQVTSGPMFQTPQVASPLSQGMQAVSNAMSNAKQAGRASVIGPTPGSSSIAPGTSQATQIPAFSPPPNPLTALSNDLRAARINNPLAPTPMGSNFGYGG